MAKETFVLTGSGAFNAPTIWTPSVGAPPRAGQDQTLSIPGGALDARGVDGWDFHTDVGGNATLYFGGQTFAGSATFHQTAPDATY